MQQQQSSVDSGKGRKKKNVISFATVVSDLIDGHQTWFHADADVVFVPTMVESFFY